MVTTASRTMPRPGQKPEKTLQESAAEALAGAEKQQADREQQQLDMLYRVLQDRIWQILTRQTTVNSPVTEIDGLQFTLLVAEPMQQSMLAAVVECPQCRQEVPARIRSMAELGQVLRGVENGTFACQECIERQQAEMNLDGERQPKPQPETAAERLQDVLRDFILDTFAGQPLPYEVRQQVGEALIANAGKKPVNERQVQKDYERMLDLEHGDGH